MSNLFIFLLTLLLPNIVYANSSITKSVYEMQIHNFNIDSVSINTGSIELNNQASKIIISAEQIDNKEEKQDLYLQALDLLNQSIKADSTNQIAFNNKVDVLIKLNRREEAIQIINLFYIKNIYDAEIVAEKGFILEKLGKKDKARDQFLKAISVYQNRPKKSINQIVSDKCNEAFLLVFIENRGKAMESLKSLRKSYPTQENIIDNFETAVLIFNKTEFLSNY